MAMERNYTYSTWKGYILSMLGGSCWAVAGVGGQYLFLEKGVSSVWVVAVRLICAGLFLTFASFLKREDIFAVFRTKRDILDVLLFAFLGAALCQMAYFWTIEASNAVTATFLCYIAPVFVLVFTLLKERRIPIKAETISCVLVVVGVFILATHGDIHTLQISPQALFWGFLSAGAFAFYSIQPQRLMGKFPVMLISGWGMLIGGLTLFFSMSAWRYQGVYDGISLIVFIIVFVFGTLLAYWFYLSGTKIIGPTKASLLSAVEPIVSLALSAVFLKQAIVWRDIPGFICILLTTFILGLNNKKK